MKEKIVNLLKFLIGWPFSIVAFVFIIKLIIPKAQTLLPHLKDISIPFVLAALGSFFVYFFIRGYIWKQFIRQLGHTISYKDSNFIWASSELHRYVPGNIWSFVGRGMRLAEHGVQKKDFIQTSLIEIEFLSLGSVLVSILAVPFLTRFFSFPEQLASVVIGAIIISCVLYVFHKYTKIKHFILPNYPPSEILFLLFLHALIFFFFGLGYYFTFISFMSINPNLIWQLVGISVLSYLIGYLSLLTPSGFGVREGVLTVALTKIMTVSTAGFLALLARLTVIIAEILYVCISYLGYRTKNKIITKVEKWVTEHPQELILGGLILIYLFYFTTVTFLRYDNFYTGKFDLGNMAQTVWNTSRGRIFTMTDPNGTQIVSRLSVHADFILVLLAPLYTLWADPRNLLFIQTFILGIGCIFIYLIANYVLKNKNIALTFAFIYLINPSVQRSNLYDFHAQTLATTFLLGAFYFFIRKRFWYFLLFSVLAGLCKEQIWLIIGLFGIFLITQYKKIFAGISLFICCILLSYFLISYAIPHALGSHHFALAYYSDFGDTPISIVKHILFSPQKTLGIILHWDRINYLKQLFMPLGFLSLFGPIFLIFVLPDLTIDLLSNNTQLHQIYYQYTTTITPFLFIAAIFGISFIRNQLQRVNNETIKQWGNTVVILYLLLVSLYGAYLYGPLPGAKEPNLDMITKPVENKEFINTYLANIRKRYSVAASNNIGSHLSQRQKIYILPLGVDKADVIVFLLNESEYPDSLNQEKALVKKLMKDPRYLLTIDRNKFVVFVKK